MSGGGSSGSNELLVIIVDTSPVFWGEQARQKESGQFTLSQCMDSLLVFANSHLMLTPHNMLAVIASHTKTSSGGGGGSGGRYEPFDRINRCVRVNLHRLITSDETSLTSDTTLASSLSLALCYINRVSLECGGGQVKDSPVSSAGRSSSLRCRILCVAGAAACGDASLSSHYMTFMNSVFTAQRLDVHIDVCILDSSTDSSTGLMKQACDISGGVYVSVPQSAGLLQYLTSIYTSHGAATAGQLVLPHRAQVDYRASCFCHRKLIHVGFVCSTCLSIYCTYSPICSTCKTTFISMLKKPQSSIVEAAATPS